MRILMIASLCLLTQPAIAQDMPSRFNVCRACHNIGPGEANKIGPVLNGIVDQPVGSVPGFFYSIAMTEAKEAGMVWDRKALTRYLQDPYEFMPGTKMTFVGLRDREDIDAIIDYLAQFGPDGYPPQ